MDKTLILIRHAHRDTSDRSLDNGLSSKGKEQAKALRSFFADRFTQEEIRHGLWLVSSPKKRCIETLEPIAKYADRSVDIHPEADEAHEGEGPSAFTERVHQFLHEWSASKAPVTVISSHGDWLPVAVFHLLGIHQEMKKGSWLEVDWKYSRGYLKWYIPHFRHFYT